MSSERQWSFLWWDLGHSLSTDLSVSFADKCMPKTFILYITNISFYFIMCWNLAQLRGSVTVTHKNTKNTSVYCRIMGHGNNYSVSPGTFSFFFLQSVFKVALSESVTCVDSENIQGLCSDCYYPHTLPTCTFPFVTRPIVVENRVLCPKLQGSLHQELSRDKLTVGWLSGVFPALTSL